MIFTDLAQLFVECWGNFVRTEIFNSLVQLLQVVPDGRAALDGSHRLVELLPGVLSVVVRQPRSVSEILDDELLGAAGAARLLVERITVEGGGGAQLAPGGSPGTQRARTGRPRREAAADRSAGRGLPQPGRAAIPARGARCRGLSSSGTRVRGRRAWGARRSGRTGGRK